MIVQIPVVLLDERCLQCPKLSVTTEDYIMSAGVQKAHYCSRYNYCLNNPYIREWKNDNR